MKQFLIIFAIFAAIQSAASEKNDGLSVNDPQPLPIVSTANNITTFTIGNETLSFHPIHDGLYATSQYSITCCRNGTPAPDPSLEPHIHDWSQEMVGYERSSKNCRRFNGYYSVPTWIMQQQKLLVVGVRCKCPDDGNLDRNCRYLPDCANGGYRSFSINLRCVCPPQWFGDLCEKFCLNGQLYKDFASGGDGLGVDRCKCTKNFYGEACDEVMCFNGGTPVKGRGCLCAPPYIGPHCEEMAGLGPVDAQSPSSFHRDLSSTIVSLFLAVALALGVYFLVRRRTQWMRRRLQARRAMMMGGIPDETRNAIRTLGGESAGMVHSGPPPTYFRTLQGQQQPENEATLYDVSGLPPPPAYSEVVKIPPPYLDGRLQAVQPNPTPQQPTEQSTLEESRVEPSSAISSHQAETPSASSIATDQRSHDSASNDAANGSVGTSVHQSGNNSDPNDKNDGDSGSNNVHMM